MQVLNRELSITELCGAVLAVFLSIAVFLLVVGNLFPRTVEAIGLGWIAIPLKGVYADCSRAENQGEGFCKPKEERFTRDNAFFRSDRVPNPSRANAAPFGLNDRD